MKKADPMNMDKRLRCGTPYLQSLHDAVKRFENGEPVGEGFTVDEVEMIVLDDWEKVGYMSMEDQDEVDVYAPLISIDGKNRSPS